MKTRANATFSVQSWDEQTWDGQPAQEVTGSKLTRAVVGYRYEGDIKGESEMRYLRDVPLSRYIPCTWEKVSLKRSDSSLINSSV